MLWPTFTRFLGQPKSKFKKEPCLSVRCFSNSVVLVEIVQKPKEVIYLIILAVPLWGYLLLWGGGSLLMFTETRSHYITQAGLKVMILLSSWPHKCEDFQCILPHMHMSGFFFFLVYTYLLSIPQPFMFFFLSFKKNSRAKKWKTVNIPKYKQNIIIMLCFFKVILGGIFYYIWFQEGGEPFLLLSTMEKLRSQINYEPKVIRKNLLMLIDADGIVLWETRHQ